MNWASPKTPPHSRHHARTYVPGTYQKTLAVQNRNQILNEFAKLQIKINRTRETQHLFHRFSPLPFTTMSDFLSADLLSSFAGVAVDAVVGRLARSDESVSTYAELKSAVEAVLPTEKAIIKVTKNITWPNYTADDTSDPCESSATIYDMERIGGWGLRVTGQRCGGEEGRERRAPTEELKRTRSQMPSPIALALPNNPTDTIQVKAGADVTIFGAVGVFQRQKAKFTGLGTATSMGQVRASVVQLNRSSLFSSFSPFSLSLSLSLFSLALPFLSLERTNGRETKRSENLEPFTLQLTMARSMKPRQPQQQQPHRRAPPSSSRESIALSPMWTRRTRAKTCSRAASRSRTSSPRTLSSNRTRSNQPLPQQSLRSN